MVTNYKRPIITHGNDFYLKITMSQFVDNTVEDFDLSKAKSVEVYLICASHNTRIDLDFEIIDTPEHNVIKAFVDHRMLHTTSYGICVEGEYENDMHFKWYALPKEALLIVPNTSGQYIPGAVEYIDVAGRVGFGEDLSDYYTKEEIDTALDYLVDEETLEHGLSTKQDVLVSGENIKTVNNISLLGSGNIEIGGGGTTTNADWNCSDPNDPAYIFNKPVIPLPQVQADWDETNPSSMAYIRNKPYIGNDYNKYLTFTALNDILLFKIDSVYDNILQYSLDNGQTWLSLSQGSYLELQSGTNIMCKMSSPTLSENGIIHFDITGLFNVSGNIMSLLYGDDFADKTDLSGKERAFEGLFRDNYNLISAEHLVLPATTLATSCYSYMFYGCESLTTAPELPATTLAVRCYEGMFNNCASLATAPELPATTLAERCYVNMFSDCVSLATAPELPATTLTEYCYQHMFSGCESLTTAPELPATTLAGFCYNNMFWYCTSLKKAPELPTATLANECYEHMFYGCRSLEYIKCLATDITAIQCTDSWVDDVATTGTFVKADNMSSWTTGINGIPSGWVAYTESEYELVRKYELNDKQDTLVSGTNIKTINNQSLLGSGNIEIGGGSTQVQSDWTQTDPTAVNYIQHKPDLSQYATQSDIADFVEASDLATVATSGSYNDLSNKPTIPAAQVNSDWNSNSGVSQILNKPDLSNYATQSDIANFVEASDLATVATSGSYNDLSNKPTIPAAQVNSDWNSNSGVSQILNKPDLSQYATQSDLSSKQDTLVSGTNIKTINGNDILGSGDLTIGGSSNPIYYVNLVWQNYPTDTTFQGSQAIEFKYLEVWDLASATRVYIAYFSTKTPSTVFSEIRSQFGIRYDLYKDHATIDISNLTFRLWNGYRWLDIPQGAGAAYIGNGSILQFKFYTWDSTAFTALNYCNDVIIPITPAKGGMVTSTTAGVKIEVVSAMPATPDSNTLYLVV